MPAKFTPGQTFVPGQAVGASQDNPRDRPNEYQYGKVDYTPSQTPNLTPSSSTTSMASLERAVNEIDSSVVPYVEAIKNAKTIAEVKEGVNAIIDLINTSQDAAELKLVESISALAKHKKNALAREGAVSLISAVAKKFGSEPHTSIEGYLVEALNVPLDLLTDKDNSVKRAAQAAIDSVCGAVPEEGRASILLEKLFTFLDSGAKWQSKVGALKLVQRIIELCPADVIEIQFLAGVPTLTNCFHDFKPELAQEGRKTLMQLVAVLDNQDVAPRIELIVDTLGDPKKVPSCVKALSMVTFVAEVTAPALSLLVPIMTRSLNQTSSSQEQLRQSVIVVENLTRLVHDPREIKPFIDQLLPPVKKVYEGAALPEVRELAGKALKVIEDAKDEENRAQKVVSTEEMELRITECGGQSIPPVEQTYAATLIATNISVREWARLEDNFKAYLPTLDQDKLKQNIYDRYQELFQEGPAEDTSAEGIEIVNANFSLAYGGRMLLNKTKLRLFKGHRYGLCGRNGAGKSTLMRSIANGKLEGFPDKSELRTCFVEHKLQGDEGDMDLVSFIASDPDLTHVKKDEIAEALASVGFDEERRAQNVGALSGGWKMKLELARAMLMKADILLLDEPTNHLDVGNVKWLQDYLVEHTDITSLIVSHDSGFLDAVCTDIAHYENKKLVYYKGNLADFVKVRPEGKAYYTLTDSNLKMAFPPPGILSGVRSNTRAIARVVDASFTYPNAPKPSLKNASCSLSMSSRVAVLGPNGAGKSTLIKVLTGEVVPTEGKVEKHPNLRIGYIAQHALQHVEQHKEKTPNQYLQWRYQNGDDREVHLKQTRIMSDEEKAQMAKPIDPDGRGDRIVEAIIGRQKLKKTFQYEIKWQHLHPKYNSMASRDYLIEQGFSKLVQEFDDHEASREGLGYRDLAPPVIRKHFEDVGLDGDIADHNTLGSLSGGQLVKVVIAGAMWNNPHLLVLDEPTNYLDRDSLGGLAIAIREWAGGVVMISHNEEFVGALCPEQWHVDNGELTQMGKTAVSNDRFEDGGSGSAASSAAPSTAASEAENDSPMNIKVRVKKKKLNRNQMKERESRRRLRHIEWLNSPKGTPKPADTDDEDE